MDTSAPRRRLSEPFLGLVRPESPAGRPRSMCGLELLLVNLSNWESGFGTGDREDIQLADNDSDKMAETQPAQGNAKNAKQLTTEEAEAHRKALKTAKKERQKIAKAQKASSKAPEPVNNEPEFTWFILNVDEKGALDIDLSDHSKYQEAESSKSEQQARRLIEIRCTKAEARDITQGLNAKSVSAQVVALCDFLEPRTQALMDDPAASRKFTKRVRVILDAIEAMRKEYAPV
ncbi:hypothetical protein QBC38DRAFT_481896, partial [Podospora fimiseda]